MGSNLPRFSSLCKRLMLFISGIETSNAMIQFNKAVNASTRVAAPPLPSSICLMTSLPSTKLSSSPITEPYEAPIAKIPIPHAKKLLRNSRHANPNGVCRKRLACALPFRGGMMPVPISLCECIHSATAATITAWTNRIIIGIKLLE